MLSGIIKQPAFRDNIIVSLRVPDNGNQRRMMNGNGGNLGSPYLIVD